MKRKGGKLSDLSSDHQLQEMGHRILDQKAAGQRWRPVRQQGIKTKKRGGRGNTRSIGEIRFHLSCELKNVRKNDEGGNEEV